MTPSIVYICSDNRSGSTLLDQLLGANDAIASVGEVLHLNAYVLEDRTQYDPVHPLRCTCGASVPHCPFWLAVERESGRPLGSFELDQRRVAARLGYGRWQTRLQRVALRNLPTLRFSAVREFTGLSHIAAESFALFDAIWAAAGKSLIVDSSKSPSRALALLYARPASVKLIFLVRDYRGVVNSKMKRGRTLEQSIKGWVRRLREMEQLERWVPEAQRMRLRYEDLCREPERVMRRLCAFLGVEFSERMLRRTGVAGHHIGGSPSKFASDKAEIELDETYLDAFTREELEVMRRVAGSSAQRWGLSDA